MDGLAAGGGRRRTGGGGAPVTDMNRRNFLARAAHLGIALTIPWTVSIPELQAAGLDGGGLSKAQWKTVDAVQRHLFPSESQAPGAVEINAASYLYFVLSDQVLDPDERALIPAGLVMFEQFVQDTYSKRFPQLTAAQGEMALRSFEETPQGRQWITKLLGYIFEALLTDPVYGGNPKDVGWQWLGHRPGFPRPPRDRRYFL